MISVSRELTDVKSEFEGGASFSVDWYAILRQAAEVVIENLNPDTLKRVVPIYGGLTNNLQIYYCPADVRVPSRIYTGDGRTQFSYTPSAQYWAHPEQQNKFTIERVNGVRFIVIRYPISGTIITLDQFNDPTGFTGGVSLAKNIYNYLPGSTASLQGTFTDTVNDFAKVLTVQQSIAPLIDTGLVMLPFYIDDILNLDHIELQIETDDSNYYKVTTTQDSIGDYLRSGQNIARFWLQNKQKVGTPDPSTIKKITGKAVMKAGKSATVIFGKLTVQSNALFFLEYFSNQLFVDGVTGAWKDTPVKGDSINLEGGAMNVFHFEACRITIRKTKTERVDAAESTRMDSELSRAYANYFKDFPSSAKPVTYNISPDIPNSPDPFYGEGFVDFPETIGSNLPADQTSPAILFADGEDLSGSLNGSNQVFQLAHAPAPAASLLLIFNGQVLQAGVGYTLAGRTVTLLAPYYTITSVAFTASYRYYAGT